ncbi:hypothetical protein RintRC_1658 [Richelia intracellularis]|nr:Phosphate ABC transporter, periplasmic phosphate-binding protein PstS (TC 3.A.1.7.1) [Richelia intracellularis]CDN12363.1 hypothetical protein RintRC_1658 [Richelia intracellularis]
MVKGITKGYQLKYPNVRISIKTGGSSQGIKDVTQGKVDIGMASRKLRDNEKLMSFTIAQDYLYVLLHRDNPVANLTKKQIVDIYINKINNWQQVGGKNEPILVVSKTQNHSTGKLFAKLFQIPMGDKCLPQKR